MGARGASTLAWEGIETSFFTGQMSINGGYPAPMRLDGRADWSAWSTVFHPCANARQLQAAGSAVDCVAQVLREDLGKRVAEARASFPARLRLVGPKSLKSVPSIKTQHHRHAYTLSVTRFGFVQCSFYALRTLLQKWQGSLK